MDKVVINPTREQLLEAIAEANEAANPHGVWRRTARIDPGIVDDVLGCAWGIFSEDGGSVPHNYRYPATTSWWVVAWWTHPNGGKHVRVAGGRTQARHTAYGHGAGVPMLSDDPWEAVYPDRARRLKEARHARAIAALRRLGEEVASRSIIAEPVLVAYGKGALLIAEDKKRPKYVELVVATDGVRTHYRIPPRFGDRKSTTYQRLTANGGGAALVQAAKEWAGV